MVDFLPVFGVKAHDQFGNNVSKITPLPPTENRIALEEAGKRRL